MAHRLKLIILSNGLPGSLARSNKAVNQLVSIPPLSRTRHDLGHLLRPAPTQCGYSLKRITILPSQSLHS